MSKSKNEPKQSSLGERAMLVRLAISSWAARKYDRKVSDEVAQAHGASDDAGRYNKLLIAKGALQDIQRIDNSARTYHYQNTLPWTDEGSRILPVANYFDYATEMKRFKSEREQAVDEFVKEYPALVRDAKARLGSLYRDDDYPEPGLINEKFSYDVALYPLPDSSDFRVALTEDTLEELREDVRERTERAVKEAVGDLWQRVFDVVSHMHDRLKQYQPKDKGAGAGAGTGKGVGKVGNPFRDSLVENLRELVEILPKLNFTEDPKLTKMTARLKASLCKYDADELRRDDVVRGEVVSKAEKILRDMSGYVGVSTGTGKAT